MQPSTKDLFIAKSNFVQFRNQDIKKHYNFEKEIGRGAYGVVYKATQKLNQQCRAVKKIVKQSVKYPSHLKNEIENLIQLDHPSILKIYQLFEDHQNLYLVTDYCQGGQLFDRLNQMGSFSESEARVVFKQLVQALNYCHKNKISHRDLKPENMIYLTCGGSNIKLIDFGFSFRWKHDMRKQLIQKKQTKLVGTAYYIAPEIIQGQYDEKCDIWSAGVILYVLVSATPPFDGRNQKQIISNVKKGFYSTETPQMICISPQCKNLIKKMLSPQNQRISFDEVLNHPWMKANQVPKTPLKLNFSKLKKFSEYSKIKKIVSNFIASKFSQKHVEQLSNMFKQIDSDNDGAISIQQLKAALNNGTQKSYHELKQILDGVDTDKNGLINYTQFVASCFQNAKIFTKQNLARVFSSIDKDQNGKVDKQELKLMLQQHNFNELHGKQIEQIMKQCDKNNDGTIDFEEFVASFSE